MTLCAKLSDFWHQFQEELFPALAEEMGRLHGRLVGLAVDGGLPQTRCPPSLAHAALTGQPEQEAGQRRFCGCESSTSAARASI